MVTYEEFKELIKEKAEEETGARVIINKVKKNNGIILDSLTILFPERNISPSIYINRYYLEYLEYMDTEEDPIQVAWSAIYGEYKMYMPKENFDTRLITEFEYVAGRLKVKLINYKKNEELLKELAYVPFLDLAAVLYIDLGKYRRDGARVTVQKSHMEIWEKSKEELFKIALKNMSSDIMITEMGDYLKSRDEYEICDRSLGVSIPMYVVTNHKQNFGAAVILCEDMLADFTRDNRCENVIMIPSSVHEMILMTVDGDYFEEYLNEMVSEVNGSHVRRQDFLSDHIYVYNTETKKISSGISTFSTV